MPTPASLRSDCPAEWPWNPRPDPRGIRGRMPVEWVAEWAWNTQLDLQEAIDGLLIHFPALSEPQPRPQAPVPEDGKALDQRPDPLGEEGIGRPFAAGRRLHLRGFRRRPRDLQHATHAAVRGAGERSRHSLMALWFATRTTPWPEKARHRENAGQAHHRGVHSRVTNTAIARARRHTVLC